jgi:O-antigen ligase
MDNSDTLRIDKLIDALVIFLLFYLPLAFGGVALQWRAPSFIAGAVLMVLSTIRLVKIGRLNKGKINSQSSPDTKLALVFMALFLLLLLVQQLPGIGKHPAPQKGWIALFTYMTAFAVFFAITTAVQSKARLKVIIFCVVIVGVFQALYGLIEQISGHQHIFLFSKHAYKDVATGTFINRNHYAAYLMMSLSLCMGIFFHTWSRRLGRGPKTHWRQGSASKLAIVGFCLVLGLTAIWASASRAAPIMLAVALILGIFVFAPSKTNKSLIVIFACVAGAAILFSLWLGISPVSHRYFALIGDLDAAGGRPGAYATAWRMWLAAPIFGHGAGLFGDLFYCFRSADIKVFYDHAHNDYLEICAETGIFGLMFFIGAIISSLAVSLKCRRRRKSHFPLAFSWASMTGVLALMFHGLVDFNFQIPANLTTFFALLAIAQVAAMRRFGD